MRMRMLLALLLSSLSWATADAQPPPGDAFEQMKSRVGEWEANIPGYGRISNSIRLVSNGKAIEETIGTAADNEVSFYTRNDGRVMLTHLCSLTPDGHQVRLETPAGLHETQNRFEFTFVEATNLHDKAAPHMRHVVITFLDQDHFDEKWTKTEKGVDTVFDLNFVRR
jgi:hypothetical protein